MNTPTSSPTANPTAATAATAATAPAAPRPSLGRELRVFLADDHQIVREGLKTLINAQPDMRVVGEASDGKAAFDRIKQLQPPATEGVDIVVMDVSMPQWNGAETTTQVKRAFSGDQDTRPVDARG